MYVGQFFKQFNQFLALMLTDSFDKKTSFFKVYNFKFVFYCTTQVILRNKFLHNISLLFRFFFFILMFQHITNIYFCQRNGWRFYSYCVKV